MGRKSQSDRTHSVTLFGASSDSIPDHYKEAAFELGRLIALEEWVQINGAGVHGIMGAATNGGIQENGEVHGIIINVYRKFEHPDLTSCVGKDSFHDRKEGLIQAGDFVVALPGGIGTLSEIFHVLDDLLAVDSEDRPSMPPMIILNTKNFFALLMEWISTKIEEENFLSSDAMKKVVQTVDQPAQVIELIKKMIHSNEYIFPELKPNQPWRPHRK